MQAIVTLLEPTIHSRIEAMWRVLELRCGLKGIRTTPIPHFSWLVAEDFQSEPIDVLLKEITAHAQPILTQTAGLGLFTGHEPVIYVLIVKNEPLMRFHRMLWEQTQSYTIGPAAYYSPDAWVPHVTLAHTDVNRTTLPCALEELSFIPFNWDVQIDNLAVVGQVGEEVDQLKSRFNFTDAG